MFFLVKGGWGLGGSLLGTKSSYDMKSGHGFPLMSHVSVHM